MKSASSILLLAFSTMILCCGCADKASSEAGSEAFVQGVQQVIQLRNSIRDGFQAGDVDAAHGPLHEVGHSLLALPKLAAAADLPEADVATVQSSVDQLMDAFGNVDKTLHGGDGSTYEEEAQTIDTAIAAVAQVAGIDSQNQTGQSQSAPATSDTEPAMPLDSPALEAAPAPALEPAPAPALEPEAAPAPEPVS